MVDLMQYFGAKPIDNSYSHSLKAAKYFVCPSEQRKRMGNWGFGSAPTRPFSAVTIGYSYIPTLTAWNSTASVLDNFKYGGAQAYWQAPTGVRKKFTRVIDNSVLMIEEAVTAWNTVSANESQQLLWPNGFYAMYYYCRPSNYPSDSGPSFYHNRTSNFLYKDAHVSNHPLGTNWNIDWQLKE